MSGTIAAAAKSALVGASNVLAGLTGIGDAGVIVAYDDPPDMPREVIFGGKISGPVQLQAMKDASSGRVRREESLQLHLVIRVTQPGQRTSESAVTRVCALSTLVENYIAANGTLGGVSGLLAAYVVDTDITSALNDDGAVALQVITVELESDLT